MITGGELDSVELLYMNGTWVCPLPSLPEPRYGHTQSGTVACGGYGGKKSARTCVTFSSDWEESHSFDHPRYDHVAWSSPRGIVLLGGANIPRAPKTSEILTEDGDTTPSFRLDHWT